MLACRAVALAKAGVPNRIRSLKIRPDLGVFLVADSVYLLQIISATKRTRGNNSTSHDRSDAGDHFQFLLRCLVDVDLTQFDCFLYMRPLRFNRGNCRSRRARWWR